MIKIFNAGLIFIFIMFILLLSSYFETDTSNHYMGNHLLKKNILEASQNTKVVFIGGSSMGWGLDSEYISEEYICYDIINFGLHGGLGVEFVLEEVIPYLSSGDTLVLGFEYQLLNAGPDGDSSLKELTRLLDAKNNNLTAIFYKSRIVLRNRINRIVEQSFEVDALSPYQNNAINSRGDIVSHLNLPSSENINHLSLMNQNLSLDKLNTLIEYVKKFEQNGINVLISFPPISRTYYEQNSIIVDEIVRLLDSELENFIVSNYVDFILEDKYFFDTVYHLNSLGRKIRTQKILIDLIDNIDICE